MEYPSGSQHYHVVLSSKRRACQGYKNTVTLRLSKAILKKIEKPSTSSLSYLSFQCFVEFHVMLASDYETFKFYNVGVD